VLPLGVAWYFISLVIALVAVVFFYRQLRCEKMNSNVQLSANP
jgi:hypothetical protein